jgi:ATP-binding cassette subfamily C protein CydCD
MLDRDLWREGRTSKWLWLTVILSALSGLVIVLQAYLLSQSIDRIFLGGDSRADILPILAFLLGAILLRAFLAWGRDTAAHLVAADIKRDLRDRLFDGLIAQGPLHTARGQTGEQTAVLTEGIEALEAYFAEYLPQLFVSILIPLTILFVVLPADPLSGLVLLLTAPLMPLFMILIGRSAERLTQRQFNQLSRMSGYFLDILQGLTTLKQLGQSKNQARNITRISDQFRQTTMGVLRVAFLSAMVLELLATLSVAIIAVSIGLRLLSGGIDFALGFFILILAPEFYLPLRQLGQRFHAGMSGTAAAARIFAMLDEAGQQNYKVTELQRKPATPPPCPFAPIHFENISVTYPGRDRPALNNVSLTIEPGQTVALVGPSGSGKSTLTALLLRFIEPDAGQIRIGDQDLWALDAQRWREQIAWAPQSPALFHGSIADNIRLARPAATQKEIIAAARLARLHDFINGQPDGYKTEIGERGLRLSGGQARRLALARAFLKDAPLLILDEPTAHLDRQTEAELQEATQALMAGRTVLVIAHRPHTIETADRVVRLENGEITEHSKRKTANGKQGTVISEQLSVASQQLSVASEQLSVPNPTSNTRHLTSTSVLRRLLGFLAPYKARIALSVLLGALTIGCGVALMATSAYLISAAALQPSIADLSVAIVGVRAFGLARGVLRYLERVVSHDVTFRVLAQVRTWFYQALEPLAPASLQQRRSGELLTHIVSDVEALQDFYVRGFYPFLVAFLAGAGVLFFFGAFSWGLALTMLLFLLLYGAALPWLIHTLAGIYAEDLAGTRAALQNQLVEGIQGMADLLAFGRMGDWQTAVHEQGARLAAIQRRAAGIAGLRSGLGELLTFGAMWAVLWLAVPLSTSGAFKPVYLAALALAAVASFELVQPLPHAAQVLAESLAAARRLFGVVDLAPQVQSPEISDHLPAATYQPAGGKAPPTLSIRNLRFRYGPGEPWLLEGLSFDLRPGDKLALTGRSGAGKTTLVNLLLRFWDFQEGEITLNGRSIRGYDPAAVRACFGVVEQRPYLFNTTIYDNVRIARPEASREEIKKAIYQAQLHEFITGLPDGYDTQVGSLGMALSGGERQRLAIARALLRDAPILLLDEPTAHLDPVTAEALMGTLLSLAKEGRSLLLITHEEDNNQLKTKTVKRITIPL